ncbi:tetratricopeptide repeat protein [Desulfogranum japonicum]|uniref:tetratricopeptide repeat protein n=1 Tax=Desulfogranum japonicum TaxID=231447 RepID=UPI000405400B|nr:tetratricopeptide repeat protein [Desulfogranum japonicum]
MIPLTRLAGFIFSLTILVASSFELGCGSNAIAGKFENTTIVPEREIRTSTPETPIWKLKWDSARRYLRAKQYEQAVCAFEELFQLKPNLYEARTEYTSLLMEMRQWKEAERSNNILLTHEPERGEHQFFQAKIALHTGQLGLAVNLFSELYVHNPIGHKGDEALAGLVQSLKLQGKSDLAIPLMEQLLVRRPGDASIRREAGMLFLGVDIFDRAYQLLMEAYPVYQQDVFFLEALAHTLDQLGRGDQAGRYWQEVVAIDTANIRANRALVQYYGLHKNLAMQLRHLQVLDTQEVLTVHETLRLTQILLATGRSDLALKKCTSYLVHDQDNVHFSQLRKQALLTLANDFLVLVEHDNANQLWEDLSKVTDSRLDVFAVMAGLLREKEKFPELADVLMIMAGEMPNDQQIRNELETLLKSQGRIQELAALSDNGREQRVN